MSILVVCEESQAVTIALRQRGYEAFSCDILPCSGNHPEWHLQQDVLPILNDGWDMIIAFTPCTHLCVSGARWFANKQEQQHEAIKFFMEFVNCNAPRVAIENPRGIMSTVYRKPDQIVQPWMFGHGEVKSTCLWLKNLPPLKPTQIVDGREPKIHLMGPVKDRSKLRSKTYAGIAKAMAEQWTNNNYPYQEYLFNQKGAT